MAKSRVTAKSTKPREGMPSPELTEVEFKKRYLSQFVDPQFKALNSELKKVSDVAWSAYHEGRKSPFTRKAGVKFSNPDYDLSVEWTATHKAVNAAQKRHDDKSQPRAYC